MSDQRMADVLRHLGGHPGIVQADDRHVPGQVRQSHQTVHARTDVENGFKALLRREQFGRRLPDDRIVCLASGLLRRPQPNLRVGKG